MKQISSLKNPLLKSIADLRAGGARKKTGTFLVEGAREIAKGLAAHYPFETCLVCPSLFSPLAAEVFAELRLKHDARSFIELDAKCYNSLVMRQDHDGIVVVLREKNHDLSVLPATKNPLILAVENIEKPGNLGGILRSADGAGVSGVVVLSSKKIDLYHPHLIRNSLGTVFSLPIAIASNEEFLALCRSRSISTFAACIAEDAAHYFARDYRQACSIIVGSEAWGLSPFWQEHCSEKIYIPMCGAADSLNVSVASGILLYEALRQRQKGTHD
jgi:TrmH family RNA methyltransferase